MDRLLFDDERIVTVALLGLFRRDGVAGKMATVGIIPIEQRRWRMLQMRVPALYLPR